MFVDYTQVLAGVFNKPPRTTDSGLRSHQDPSFVVALQLTFVAWIPLVDINRDNGGFFVLAGSHHLYPYRPVIQPPVFVPCERLLTEAGDGIDTNVGDLVVFDTGLIHWSLSNRGQDPRPAIQLVTGPGRRRRSFFRTTRYDGRTRIELYKMPLDHVRLHQWYLPDRPVGYPIITSIDCQFTDWSEAALIDRVALYNARLRAQSQNRTVESSR